MAENTLGRNQVFAIKNADGTPFHDLVLHKATYDSVVMSLGDKITGDVYYRDNNLNVTMGEYIEFKRDPDNANEESVKFLLISPPTIIKEGIVSDNSELRGMTKYSFEFYHPMYKLGNMPLTDIAVTSSEERYLSQNKTFFWCGTGNDFIAKLNANLYYSEWVVVASTNEQSAQRLAMMPSDVPTKKAGEQGKSNVLSFDKNTIADGLKTIYDTWDIPFVIDTLHQGEYYDVNGNDYYSAVGGNKRFVVVVGMPSNEIIDTESGAGVVVQATSLATESIYYNPQPINAQRGKKIIVESLTDGAMPIILNSSHNGVIGTEAKTFESDMTIYVGLYSKSGSVRYIYDGDEEDIFVFRYGQGVGLKNNSRTPRNNKIITRISASGSEDNVPYGYPQIQWYGNQSWDYTVNNNPSVANSYPIYDGIVGGQKVRLIKHPFTRTRLMPTIYATTLFNKISPYLANGNANPNYDPTLELVDYYDADNTYENPVVASSPSYEIHEFDGIKPELNRQLTIQGAVPLNDDLTVADSWVDDLKPDSDEYAQSYFRITLPPLGFDVYACASVTQQMQINMRSGDCIGCTFEIQVDWEDYKLNFYDSDGNFDPVIGNNHPRNAEKYPNSTTSPINVTVKKEISTFGTLMPNIYQQPHSGDSFVILGISLPTSYITNAQQRLDETAKQYMRENNIHYFDYPLKFDEYFLARHPSILRQIRTNTIVRFDYAGQILNLCVKQITIKFGEKALPQYNITLTDNVEVVLNQISQIANDVSRISTMAYQNAKQASQGGGGSGNAQDKLSKVSDDTASGLITFLKGITTGTYSRTDPERVPDGLPADNSGATILPDGTADFIDLIVRGMVRGNLNVSGSIEASSNVHTQGMVEADNGIKTRTISSPDFTGYSNTDTGWSITNDRDERSHMTVDELYVRYRMIVEELLIKQKQVTGGDFMVTCASCRIIKTEFLDANKQALSPYVEANMPYLLRNVRVFRQLANAIGILSKKKRVYKGITSDMLSQASYVRCYFLASDGDRTIDNWWQANERGKDLAFCQTMDLTENRREAYVGESRAAANVRWWRRVEAVSTTPVEIDGKQYHWFDVAYNQQQEASRQASYCEAGSDIPAAGDEVVQLGNTSDTERMNAISIEVNCAANSDAPCIKALYGIYTFSLQKCWWGGSPLRMVLSPKSGYQFYGPSFKLMTQYDTNIHVPVDREEVYWTEIDLEKDDYSRASYPAYSDDATTGRTPSEGYVRKCYYYDRISHHGSIWLCTAYPDEFYWAHIIDPVTGEAEKVDSVPVGANMNEYERRQRYTIEEPSDESTDWKKQVERGEPGGHTTSMTPYFLASANKTPTPSVTVDISTGLPTNYKQGGDPDWSLQKKYLFRLDVYDMTDGSIYLSDPYYYQEYTTQGPKGDDGYTVTFNPAAVILTQSMTDTTDFGVADQAGKRLEVKFTVKKGVNGTVSVVSIGNVASSIVAARWAESETPDTIQVYGVISTASSTGVITATLTLSDGATINVSIPVCLNLLGTFNETIQNGVKQSLADAQIFSLDAQGNIIANSYLYQRVDSAQQSIQTMSGTVNGHTTAISENKQTADSIKMSVTSYDNLLANSEFNPPQGNTTNTYCPSSWSRSNASTVYADKSLGLEHMGHIVFVGQNERLSQLVWGTSSGTRLVPGKWHTLTFYAKVEDSIRILLEGLEDHIDEIFVVNGREVASDASGDDRIITFGSTDTSGYARYEVKFKVKDTLSAVGVTKYLRFIAIGDGLHIAIPRLVSKKVAGIDIESGVVDVQADSFRVINSDGEQTMGLDEYGNFEVRGTVKARNFYHGVCLFTEGGTYSTNWYYVSADTDWTQTYGLEIGDHIEVTDEMRDAPDFSSAGLVQCTGPADVVVMAPSTQSWESGFEYKSLLLPTPEAFEGKIVEVFIEFYGLNTNRQIYVGCVEDDRFARLIRKNELGQLERSTTSTDDGMPYYINARPRFISVKVGGGQCYWLDITN